MYCILQSRFLHMATMSEGVKLRAKIDAETVKGLLQINGGGAVALLVFLPTILAKPAFSPLAAAVLYALFSLQSGLVFALVHNVLRRKCSLTYEQAWSREAQPSRCRFSIPWLDLDGPCICNLSRIFMYLSIAAFIFAGSILAWGYGRVDFTQKVEPQTKCWRVQELKGETYRVNECTGLIEGLHATPPNSNPDSIDGNCLNNLSTNAPPSRVSL